MYIKQRKYGAELSKLIVKFCDSLKLDIALEVIHQFAGDKNLYWLNYVETVI